jgi:hypothetical protein
MLADDAPRRLASHYPTWRIKDEHHRNAVIAAPLRDIQCPMTPCEGETFRFHRMRLRHNCSRTHRRCSHQSTAVVIVAATIAGTITDSIHQVIDLNPRG